jgi:hypothetical protein
MDQTNHKKIQIQYSPSISFSRGHVYEPAALMAEVLSDELARTHLLMLKRSC